MRKQVTYDTGPERALRTQLFRLGLRYRIHRRPVPELRRFADVLFPSARVAVFVDGCYWHGCELHKSVPQANAQFWRAKIEGNRTRDRETDSRLTELGWAVVRVWEHDEAGPAAVAIERLVRERFDQRRSKGVRSYASPGTQAPKAATGS